MTLLPSIQAGEIAVAAQVRSLPRTAWPDADGVAAKQRSTEGAIAAQPKSARRPCDLSDGN